MKEFARRHRVEKFVSIGTIYSYPKAAPVPFREEHLWDGYSEETNAPYGLAKRMLLVQAQTYGQEDGFHAIHLLPVNLCGPGDNCDPDSSHVIPALAEAIVLAPEQYDGAEPVKASAGFQISIRDRVELVGEMTGSRGRISWEVEKPNGQPRRSLDVTRAANAFGFRDKTDFRSGLDQTIDWYRQSRW